MIDCYLLGTSGMMPLPERWLSSLLIRVQGEITLFDCGDGTQIPLHSSGWGFRRISTICFSHMHADHVAGLPGILHAITHSGRTDPVTIYGPEGTADVVMALRTIAPDLPYRIDLNELSSGDRFKMTEGVRGTVVNGDHHMPCLAYRFDVSRSPQFLAERAAEDGLSVDLWKDLQRGLDVAVGTQVFRASDYHGPERRGVSVGVVTDTRPLPQFPAFFADVDLMVCEGTYGDSNDLPKAIQRKHMTFSEAAGIARSAGAGTLWLTHFSLSVEDPESFRQEAAAIHPNVVIGYTGLEMTIAFPEDPVDQST
ncbi:ribonuclease Z [soil metagenome]